MAMSTHVRSVPLAFDAPKPSYPAQSGPCDPIGISLRTQLQNYRYISLLWTFTVAAPGAPGVIAANTQRTALVEGFDDIGTSAGWGPTIKLTQQQTNLFANGSLNNAKDGAFIGRSLGIGVQRAFVYDETTGARTYSDITDKYADRAARALLESLSMSLIQKDEGTVLFAALPFHWPGAQQVSEDNYATTNKALGANILLPLGRDYVFMDDNKGSQNTVLFNNATPLNLASDPAEPIPAGFSVPVNFFIYGDVVSVETACEVAPTRSASDMLATVDGLMARGWTQAQIAEFMRSAR